MTIESFESSNLCGVAFSRPLIGFASPISTLGPVTRHKSNSLLLARSDEEGVLVDCSTIFMPTPHLKDHSGLLKTSNPQPFKHAILWLPSMKYEMIPHNLVCRPTDFL